jgi:hypothetical protein
MKRTFEFCRKIRTRFLNLIEEHSLATVNAIPIGFNNNLLWNFGHVVITQQLIAYKLSGLEMQASEELIARYRKGSKPDGKAQIGEWKALIDLAKTSIDRMEADYEAGVFTNFQPYTTEAGIQLNTIEEAIAFLPIHEGMHFGYSLALKRMLD